jgi:hypothetical protein
MDGRRILISPLNWGLGHAGRMIPLALELRKRGNEIIFGVDSSIIPVIEKDLPDINIIAIPGAVIRYSGILPQYISIFLQVPRIVAASFREFSALKRLARQLKPDIIISDNRFGFFHKDIFSVYITHQLRVPFPGLMKFLEPAAAWLNRKVISNYDLCLVPDYPGNENLSGRLSHQLQMPDNVFYMGPLSKFSGASAVESDITLPHPYYCLILSGPEPQRSLLFDKITRVLSGTHLVVLIGSPAPGFRSDTGNTTVITNPDTATMKKVICGSSLVISRAGYSTVMELVSLGKGGVIVPTPGQTEQEYLGQYHDGRHGFITLKQTDLEHLREISPETLGASSPCFADRAPLFEEAVSLLLEQKKKS